MEEWEGIQKGKKFKWGKLFREEYGGPELGNKCGTWAGEVRTEQEMEGEIGKADWQDLEAGVGVWERRNSWG